MLILILPLYFNDYLIQSMPLKDINQLKKQSTKKQNRQIFTLCRRDSLFPPNSKIENKKKDEQTSVKTVRYVTRKNTDTSIAKKGQYAYSLVESKHFHQIDAIFTQLEDCLIQAKDVFRQKIHAELNNLQLTDHERHKRIQRQIQAMQNLKHYFFEVTREFIQTKAKTTRLPTNNSRKLSYL